MKRIIIFLPLLVAALFILACSDSNDSDSKQNIFIYGLIGSSIENGTEEDETWVYSRVLNSQNYENLTGYYTDGNDTTSLIKDISENYISFADGDSEDNPVVGQIYDIGIKDTDNTYSGVITVLPGLVISNSTLNGYQLNIWWNDINADFYEGELNFSYSLDEAEYYYTEENSFSIELNTTGPEEFVNITVAAFKGFSPYDNASGNIDNCHGYFFSYTYDFAYLDLNSGVFTKPEPGTNEKEIDKILENIASGNFGQRYLDTNGLDYIHTYAYISSEDYSTNEDLYFTSFTAYEPAGAIESYIADLNGISIPSHPSGSFIYAATRSDYYNADYDDYTLNLTINDQQETATVVMADTFSITDCPDPDFIPEIPFQITWRRPQNADFFFVDIRWVTESYSSIYFTYVTDDTSYVVNDLPELVDHHVINVYAVNGSNAMHLLEPNLPKHNGYFHSVRRNNIDITSSSIVENNNPNNTTKQYSDYDQLLTRFNNLLENRRNCFNQR